MNFRSAYTSSQFRSLQGARNIVCLLAIMLIQTLSSNHAEAQGTSVSEEISHISSATEDPGDILDEFTLTLNVQRIGSTEIPAVIMGENAYLPVKEIFDFLKLKCALSVKLDSLSGYIITPNAYYNIDKLKNRITYNEKITRLKPEDLIKTSDNLFLRSDYFGRVFGLDCKFDFRSLSILLTTSLELPAIKEMNLDRLRKNINQLKGEKKADTTIRRKFKWLKLGAADWAVTNSTDNNGVSDTRVDLGLGTMLLGGEANVYLNYNSSQDFDKRQQFYRWRYVNNDNRLIKQITAGQIFTQATSTLDATVTGVQVTNTPTTYRRTYGSYRLSNKTEPGWMVELYVNGILVNYVKADASGFFTFEVPIVYGNSIIKLKFYSPWGEERIREENITIPFNFVPLHQLEYSMSAGYVDDMQKSKFSRANFNYGLSRRLTIGGGAEYLSTLTSGKSMPFINASLRLGANLLLTGEHVYGVRSKGLLSYRLPANIQLDINYSKYDAKQTAVKFNYQEEKRAVLSVPIRSKKFSGFSRLTVHQFQMLKTKTTTAELLFSSVFAGISSNLTTFAEVSAVGNPLLYSNLSFTLRLPARIRFTPQALYEYRSKQLTMIRSEAEKSIFNHGFINVAYQHDLAKRSSYTSVGFRYNFSFAQTAVYVQQNKDVTLFTQSARGSMIYNGAAGGITLNNQISVGKGGIIVVPYLDLNCNGKRDKGESKAHGLNMRINGGRMEVIKKDTIIRVTGLDAYTNYFIELDKSNFENIAWQLKKKSINVTVDPNHMTVIEVPVAVVGEVSGTVSLKGPARNTGQGRIIVNIFDEHLKLAGRTITENDGYFNFLGLAPGKYKAEVDKEQLSKLSLQQENEKISFSIASNKDGDVADGLEIVLIK